MTGSKRLHRTDWINAGIKALAQSGHGALKAEPMARVLGTTKGSFYWHFADVPAFHDAVLEDWSTGALTHLADALEGEPTATARLRHLAQLLAHPSAQRNRHLRAEPAMRAWAQVDKTAAKSLAKVDTARRETLADLLAQIGVSNPEMAQIIQAAAIGMPQVTKAGDPIGSLVDLVLALR